VKRADGALKTILTTQIRKFRLLGFEYSPTTDVKTSSIDELEAVVTALMQRRNLKLAQGSVVAGGEQGEGAAGSDAEQKADADDTEESESESSAWCTDDNDMPCCDVKWRNGVPCVRCNICKEWRHCTCEGIAVSDARQRPRYECTACLPAASICPYFILYSPTIVRSWH
jgi:hypothetical protein